MKSTGVVRKLDNLGRIVIPIELRKTMDIAIKDTLEIFTEGDEIILKKYSPVAFSAMTHATSRSSRASWYAKSACQK